jgi:hypothetical protein
MLHIFIAPLLSFYGPLYMSRWFYSKVLRTHSWFSFYDVLMPWFHFSMFLAQSFYCILSVKYDCLFSFSVQFSVLIQFNTICAHPFYNTVYRLNLLESGYVLSSSCSWVRLEVWGLRAEGVEFWPFWGWGLRIAPCSGPFEFESLAEERPIWGLGFEGWAEEWSVWGWGLREGSQSGLSEDEVWGTKKLAS